MKILKLYLVVVLGFSCSTPLNAQINPHSEDLASYLEFLEEEFDITFSYADEEIENLKISRSKDLIDLKQHLHFLKNKTPFRYIRQNQTRILIVPLPSKKTICISVTNELTGERINNSFLRLDAIIFKSDLNGEYRIPVVKQELHVVISAKGFAEKALKIRADNDIDCYSFKLTPFFEMLDEVFLTNLLTSGIQKFASGGLEINYKDFGLLPGLVEPDVLQSLQALPGITSRKESVSYLNVRGGTHDQNLFLWDGIKMYHTSHYFGMISAFNPYMTQKVTLIKNGTSSKFGDGVSSLINMKTSDSIASHVEAEAGLNLINADAILRTPLNSDSSMEVSFRRSINSIWESPTYDRYFDKVFQNTAVTDFESSTSQQNDDFSFYDATLNYKHKLSGKDYLKANLFYAKDRFSLNRFEIEGNQINTRSSDLEQSNLAGGLYYERNWSSQTQTQVQFYTSKYNQSSVNTNFLDAQSLEQINEVRETGFKINVQTQLFSNLVLESGYQFNETGVLNSEEIDNPGFFRELRNSILTNSIYSQFNYQSKSSRLNLSLGGRLNHYSKFNKVLVEPRLNLSYQLIDDLFLEVLAERKSQVTSQVIDLQTDFLGVENRRWIVSNPDNSPIIESWQWSSGLNYIKPNWFINLDLYNKKVEGITSQGQGFQNQFRFVRTHGSYDIKGIDFLINKSFKSFSGWISYSLSENNYQFDELQPSQFHNNQDIRHVISTGLSFEKKGFKLSTGFNWHSGAPTTLLAEEQPLVSQQINYQEPNAARLPDYFRLDFSSTYTFPIGKKLKALAGLSFWNLLGNSNVFNQFYQLDQNQDIQTITQEGLNFTPNFLFRLEF
ncbi:TonB-dependent receptor plug domain-containing protein [Psychroflexus tropicus]|uniref:TonB-dependent receptor plug domain-containing protein n=1 Tax=Psychroflexus tropicus TaxID=197345 RepID=UPI00036A8566|nr:TonB-dependent receptor [Psychroflexus tropicus]